MRVKGSRKPPAYEIEHLHDETALLVFYENIVAVQGSGSVIDSLEPVGDGEIELRPQPVTPDELRGMTRAALQSYADELGLNMPSSLTKPRQIEFLEVVLFDFEYDEYRIVIQNAKGLEDRVAADEDAWREHVKAEVIKRHTDEVLAYRDSLLDQFAWTLDAGVALSAESEAAVIAYRKELNELEKRPEFPFIENYPNFPKIERIPLNMHQIRGKEIALICERIINAGISLEIDGEILHFSLTHNDQINLTNALGAIEMGAPAFPYHNDGGLCRLYSADEIRMIAEAATKFVMYHRTYCNHLLYYLRSLTCMDELAAVHYGMQLPEELHKSMMGILAAMQGGM